LRIAVAAVRAGRARALVTGPIHKARLAARGFRHPGHTEFLAELCGVDDVVMGFLGGRVRVSLATVHLPVRQVADALTTARVERAIHAAHRALVEWVRGPRARIAVCGLNPHAGDQGLLGHEDQAVVAPAVRAAVAGGIDAVGPWSAEACFRAAVKGEVDWVVAMYHDQGLAPLKALEWAGTGEERAVNVTLGLPILRVGVDHGTADDIAGRGIADESSLLYTLRFADRFAAA
jgi:4-hydroxythreonine-4-phosphate dehydrogenase